MTFATGAMAQAATQVDEVIVTAQKMTQNLNDVPVSVTAVGGEKLDVIRSSGGDIRVLSARIPSVLLESSFGRTFPRPLYPRPRQHRLRPERLAAGQLRL